MVWRVAASLSLVIFSLAVFLGCRSHQQAVPTPPKVLNSQDAFNSVQVGMSHGAVIERLGGEGTKTPENDMKVYSWGQSNAIFRKDTVVSVTGALFARGVKIGMNYRQVVAKAGAEGKLAQTQSCYTWKIGKSSFHVYFTDDKVSNKMF